MSGSLEVAAGIFAIIGVADVVVRMGREVYSFLRDIADAPDEVGRLSTAVKETALLAETVKQLLDSFASRKEAGATDGMLALFESALKSLQRELQNLRILSARYRSVSKTWNRVKYVLDERKVSKTFNNLERSKSLLVNSLQVASRQRSDDQHHELLNRHDTNQATLVQGQELLGRLSVYQYQETKRISKILATTHQEQVSEHWKTRELLSEKIGYAIAAGFEKYRIPRTKKWTRNVYFYGERRDMIMAYLLLVKPHLETAFQNILNDGIERFPPHHIDWLQHEFDHLIASAAQEEAAAHHESSATSIDRWHYSGETMPYHSLVPGCEIKELNTTSVTPEADYANLYLSAPVMAGERAYTQTTPFGSLRIQSPLRACKSKFKSQSNEVNFTFTCGIGQSVHAIHAHFLRNAASASNPGLCAQLSVFTLAESEIQYDQLFASANVEEFDNALRKGQISPYHINREGRNLCLYYASKNTRIDLLDYLAGQGIGVSNLNHDASLVAGLFMRSIVDDDRTLFEKTFDYVIYQIYESSSFLFEMTTQMLIWDYYQGRPRSLLRQQIQRLQQEDLIPESIILDDDPWDWPSVSSIIAPLFEVDAAYINTIGPLGRNRLQRCYSATSHESSPGDPVAFEEIPNALIRMGVDVHHRDHDGLTPSMYARRRGGWDAWCRALARNGLRIEDVVREDDTEWLLDEDWRNVMKEKHGELAVTG